MQGLASNRNSSHRSARPREEANCRALKRGQRLEKGAVRVARLSEMKRAAGQGTEPQCSASNGNSKQRVMHLSGAWRVVLTQRIDPHGKGMGRIESLCMASKRKETQTNADIRLAIAGCPSRFDSIAGNRTEMLSTDRRRNAKKRATGLRRGPVASRFDSSEPH